MKKSNSKRRNAIIMVILVSWSMTTTACGSIEQDNDYYLKYTNETSKYYEEVAQTTNSATNTKAAENTTEISATTVTDVVVQTEATYNKTETCGETEEQYNMTETYDETEEQYNMTETYYETDIYYEIPTDNEIEFKTEPVEVSSEEETRETEVTLTEQYTTLTVEYTTDDNDKYIPVVTTTGMTDYGDIVETAPEVVQTSEESSQTITTTEESTEPVVTTVTTYNTKLSTECTIGNTLEAKPDDSTNLVNPSKYGIKASDENILIDESVLTNEYGLLDIYKKYSDFHIAWKLESLDSGKSLEFNNSNEDFFSSCCTIKAALALYVCQQLESGLSGDTLDTELYYDRTNSFHAHGGSGNIQKTGSGNYTIRKLLTECIVVSDNDAYCVLLDHFGIQNFNNWLKKIGSTSVVSKANVMGFANLENRAIEWKAIVNYCDQSKSTESELLWSILEKAESSPIRNAINKYTTLDCTVAHKSGWYNGRSGTSNDCAVITLKNGKRYLMIILTERRGGTYNNNLVEAIATDLTNFMDSVD